MSLNRRQFVTALIASGRRLSANTEHRPESLFLLARRRPSRILPARKLISAMPHATSNPLSVFQTIPERPSLAKLVTCDTDTSKSLSAGMENFGTVVEFSLAGFQDDKILRQWIESPAIPIVHTLIDRPAATFELIAFATRHRRRRSGRQRSALH